jgi:hypothetical protein
METTEGMRLTLTRYACKQAATKGITAEVIQACFDAPSVIEVNPDREGQYRITNDDITIVGAPVSETEFRGITMRVAS